VQLTSHTDYALRTLIALGLRAPDKLTATEIGTAYNISVNHLLKIIQQLAELGYVETLRGKTGGVRLAKAPEEIVIGRLVRDVENDLGVVACLRQGGEACIIDGSCRLRGVLDSATRAFLTVLDEYTLADILKPKTQLAQLLAIRPVTPAT
jgi:Rrf2 family nitric oxide-sensitive transcriptional repressor